LIVLLDNVGFSDFGCYGSPIKTPTIDRLAAQGLRYTCFHTTAMCSTTRAALLTGRNHHSVGVGCLANFDSGLPGYRGKIAKVGPMAHLMWSFATMTERSTTLKIGGWGGRSVPRPACAQGGAKGKARSRSMIAPTPAVSSASAAGGTPARGG